MRPLAAGLAFLVAGAGPVFAQTFLGPSRCVGCHTHADATKKWRNDEPARFGPRAHFSSLGRLDDNRAANWAKAIGLDSAYAAQGACVGCHGTVFRNRANGGVSCESCHGPSSGYVDIHQVKGGYEKSVAAGMLELRGKTDAIARLCVRCHAVDDSRLVAAGHPAGADFDAGRQLSELVHWKTTYDYAIVTAAARAIAPRRAVAAPVRAPAAPPAPADAASTPGAAGPAAALPAGSGAARSFEPPPPPSAWDAAQPLPQDYVPEASEAAAVDRPRPAVRPLAPLATPGPSIAEEPLLPIAPRLLPPEEPAKPKTPSAAALAARGRALLLLSRLLGSGVQVPGEAPPAPGNYKGPDGELWRIQDEAYVLLWKALRKAPE